MAPKAKSREVSRMARARGSWAHLSHAGKTLVGLGAVGAAIVGISGGMAVGTSVYESHRPWADRAVEAVVAGLQLQADQRELKDVEDRIFQIEFELNKSPRSQFLRAELQRQQERRDRLRRRINNQIEKK